MDVGDVSIRRDPRKSTMWRDSTRGAIAQYCVLPRSIKNESLAKTMSHFLMSQFNANPYVRSGIGLNAKINQYILCSLLRLFG